MSIDTKYATLQKILDTNPGGWAAEFGVYSGYSLNMIAQHMPVIGFDSFEGLPEDWREGFPKGTFATNGDEALYMASPFYNQMLVKGWFDDTVPDFPFPPLGLVHIDCDLYSSTITALEGIKSALRVGTWLVFDEYHGYDGWEQHEARAWTEFCYKYGIRARSGPMGPQEMTFQIQSILHPVWDIPHV